MLQPSTYPEEFPRLKKSELLREQSILLKQEHNFYRVPLTMSFRNTRNSVGVAMRTNRGSGHECTGLNDGSKNTVATTYLADAWNWGAEIFCGCEVKFLEQHRGNGGYVIHFSWHGSGRSVFKDDFKNQLFWVRAVCSGSTICLCLRISSSQLAFLHRKNFVSSEQVLLVLQKFCCVQGSEACRCLQHWEGTCLAMEISCYLVRS